MRPATAAEALCLTVAAARDLELSLDIRCACGRTVIPAFRGVLIERPHLARVTLARLVPRIRCEPCGRPPAQITLLDAVEHASAAGNCRSGPRPWHLVLSGGDDTAR